MAPSLSELTKNAQALKQAGRMDEAVAAYREIAKTAPANGAVLHNLAAALGDAGLNAEAVEKAQAALATGLNAPETWLVLARSQVVLGRMEEAAAAFEKAIAIRPSDATAHRELAQLIWMQTGDINKSLAALNAEIARAPHAVDLLMTRAYVLGQTGDADAEYEEMKRVVARTGGPPQVEMAASTSAVAAGDYKAALAHARKACAVTPHDPNALAAMCRALLAIGEAKEASRIAGQLMTAYPLDQNYIALQAIAWRLLEDPRYHELYDYDALVRVSPLDAPGGWRNLDHYLNDLIEALDRHHQYRTHPFNQSVRHGSQLPSIDKLDDPALKAFKEAASGPVQRYLDAVGRGQDPVRRRNKGGFRIATAWSVRLPESGFHIDHVHPEGWLSSACYLRLPETLGADGEATDRAGWLKLGEPGVPTTPKLDAEHFIKPRRGHLAIFPAYMWHGTVPFSSKTTRLTAVIDIAPLD